MKKTLLSALLLASTAVHAQSHAQSITCHVTYGGETKPIRAVPVTTPYTVPTVPIGSYFQFRVVLQTTPRDLASVNIYIYGDQGDAPVIIQHNSHDWPVRNRGRYGFTGLQRVYEPMRDGELEYWCEAK